MGFLSRLRGGAADGSLPGADDTQLPATPSAGESFRDGQREPPTSHAILPAASLRGPHALFSFVHQMPSQRTTAAERAFMDLKRGSND